MAMVKTCIQSAFYYVSKKQFFGVGQKVDDYTDFSFLKTENFDAFIEKIKRSNFHRKK